jgi:hypothetical protein
MPAIAIKSGAWKLLIWLAARLCAPRRCPLPLSGVRGQIEALLHSRQGMVVLAAIGVLLLVQGVRSAWWDVYGRWYGR